MGTVLVRLVQTSSAHPSQWEGETERGQAFYARYRADTLSWGFGATVDDAKASSMTTCPTKTFLTRHEGILETGELLTRLRLEYRPTMAPKPAVPADQPMSVAAPAKTILPSQAELIDRLNKVEEENADHIRELARSERKCSEAEKALAQIKSVPILGPLANFLR